MTIMTQVFAEKCGLGHLIDKRFQGVAVGVGSSKIIGRIHAAPVKVGPVAGRGRGRG
jgi:DNA damage-inducible protein 1